MSVNRRLTTCLGEDRFIGTDLVKMIVVVSFSAISLMLTAVAPDYGIYPVSSLLYCIPILLVVLWYPGQGLRVTALLIAGFALIRVYLLLLGFAVDLVMAGLQMMFFFWVFGAATLFSQVPHLVTSRCRQIVENTREAKFLCNPETLRLLCASRQCADILGYEPHELIGATIEKFWPDEAGKARFAAEMGREGYMGNIEATFHTKNGEARTVLISCRMLVTENLFECTVVDTGRLGDERAALIRANGRLMELIRQSNDIFFMQDIAGRILHFSWLHASEHGISPETLIGQGIDAFLPADLAAQHMVHLREVVEEQKNAHYDLDLELEGTHHAFSITMAPYYGADGSLIGIAGLARNITEMRRQRLACRKMVLEVDQWKGLATALSHELRTPLQPLIGYLQMITDDPGHYNLTEATERHLLTCLECARQEQAAVEKMVELSLLAADPIELAIQDVPLRHLANSVISGGNYDREAEFSNEVPEDAHLLGDREWLYLVLESLISNAVKYSEPPKKVWIRYAESNKNYYIVVCDNGIGIPAGTIRSIFGPLYTGGTEQLKQNGDRMGLGLSIANKYIRLHGGEITVTSVVGEGSIFTIRIPKEV